MQQVCSLTLVRHGRTSYNAAGRVQGSVDIPLDDVGLWQVQQTAQTLQQLYVNPQPEAKQIVVTSDLERSQQTAHAFADPLGLEVHVDKRLRERNFGDWEGKSVQELAQEFPEDFESWQRGLGGEMLHHAESHIDAGSRGWQAIQEWSHRGDDTTDLFVFSHGALIENALQVMFQMYKPFPDFVSVASMRNAHWARLKKANIGEPDRWIMVDYNHGPACADSPLWQNPHS